MIPPPPDWGANIHVTGYWFLDAGEGWTPPTALSAFLEAGPPPVYIGFGSMGSRDPAGASAVVLDAVRQTGQRAILAAAWGGLHAGDLPENVLLIDAAPHAWLFPSMAAVVHHGGAGTTAAGLAAGVPAVVIPFLGHQPFWGQRVAHLGVGPSPIARKQLTAERLAQALATALKDQAMRRRAVELGARIRAEDGIGSALALIERVGQETAKSSN